MTFTVDDAVRHPVLGRSGAVVVAGRSGLRREVRWVHSAEIPDIARFLIGGELLLTAGLGLGTDAVGQRQFVTSLYEAGAAGLVLELSGRAFAEVPAALVEACDAVALPLVAIPGEVRFLEIASAIHAQLAAERVTRLEAEERVTSSFTRLLLSGSDYVSVIRTLADHVRKPVVLENRAHQVLAYAGREPEADVQIANWGAHSWLQHAGDDSTSDATPSAPSACSRADVVLRDELWGRLHVMSGTDQTLTSLEQFALGQAATTVAISLLGAPELHVQSQQRAGVLINRLMMGDLSATSFLDRALRLGKDLRNRSLVVVIAGTDGTGRSFGEKALAACLDLRGWTSLVAEIGDAQTIAIVALPDDVGEADVVRILTAERVRCGVSRTVEPSSLFVAVQQARNAAVAAAASDVVEVKRFDDLGTLRLLVILSQGPELAKYIEDELGPLMRHDAAGGNELMPTLKVFLECDGRKSEAAAKLYVQRRTLYYRLERIEEVLGVSLDADTRQRLFLAVRGLELLKAPTVSVGT